VSDYRKLRGFVENPWATLRFCKRHLRGQTHIVALRGGPALTLRGGYADAHMFDRIFVRDEYRLEPLGAGKLSTVLDLGGNVGLFTVRVAPLVDRVIAYEPCSINFSRLQNNVAGIPNIEAVRSAVGSHTGKVRLYHPQSDALSGVYSLYPELGRHEMATHEEVEIVSLEEVFARHAIDRCDLLKVDVEGAEYEILYSAPSKVLERIDRIHAEYHDVSPDDPKTRVDALLEFLADGGYDVAVVPHARKRNHGMLFASRRGAPQATHTQVGSSAHC